VKRFAEPELLAFAAAVVRAVGAPATTATAVAESLVQADLRGVGTHGVVRLPSYRRQVEDGEVVAHAQPVVLKQSGATALVDGRRAFGARTAGVCASLAADIASKMGAGVVTARGCMHFGATARYALMSAHRGLVGLAAANTPAVMAPFGGAEPAVGNNPLAVAAPMPDGREPFVLDMAQTVVARGRIKLAEMAGRSIPGDWAVDADGRATTDPARALAGALLPFGGYKGYGLALAVEALTAVLAGGGLSPELANTSMTGTPAARDGAVVGSVGAFFMAVDPDAFVGRSEFERALGRLADAVARVPPAPGFAEVLFPGELEQRAAADAAANGIPLDDSTVEMLAVLAAELGVALPVAA
jgi:LDH2 family malate/lactate/ureidoglycolate dehydrogenase